MEAKVADLQKQLEDLANQMRRDERDAARKLDEAAGTIRDKRIREMLRYSRNTLNGGTSQYAKGMEESLTNNLNALSKKIGEASGAMGKQAKQDAVARAAERARDLVREMESMDQRLRDKAQQGAQASRGSQGSRGSQSSQGQGSKGSQGSEGSQGSRGGQAAQGQDAQNGDGQANGGARNGGPGGNSGGAWGGGAWGGPWNGGYGYYNPEDVRQFRRDFREWANDAEALRRQLQASGLNPRELDDIIRDLQRFDSEHAYTDPKSLEQLHAAAIDKLKKFEFSLRRKADAGNDSLSLSGSDQVPDGFRQAIEEYYRSLAKKPLR
jgi:hypothetical protein